MAAYHPVSLSRHAKKYWQRVASYSFASKDTVAPLVLAEVARAAGTMVLAFGEQDNTFVPVAVLSLLPECNLYVGPDKRWVMGYVPASYRSYPFTLANTGDGKKILCIDENSGLVTDTPEGEPFFDENDRPAPEVAKILSFLQQVDKSRLATANACGCLQRHGLIHPWPINLKTATGNQSVAGLFCIDEARLNALSAEALYELQQGGALSLAYSQMLSMQHLSLLSKLAEMHAKSQTEISMCITQERDLDLEFLNSETISFGGLG